MPSDCYNVRLSQQNNKHNKDDTNINKINKNKYTHKNNKKKKQSTTSTNRKTIKNKYNIYLTQTKTINIQIKQQKQHTNKHYIKILQRVPQ